MADEEFRQKVALAFLDKCLGDDSWDIDVAEADEDIQEHAKNISDAIWQYTEAFIYGGTKQHSILKLEPAIPQNRAQQSITPTPSQTGSVDPHWGKITLNHE